VKIVYVSANRNRSLKQRFRIGIAAEEHVEVRKIVKAVGDIRIIRPELLLVYRERVTQVVQRSSILSCSPRRVPAHLVSCCHFRIQPEGVIEIADRRIVLPLFGVTLASMEIRQQ